MGDILVMTSTVALLCFKLCLLNYFYVISCLNRCLEDCNTSYSTQTIGLTTKYHITLLKQLVRHSLIIQVENLNL